MLKRSLLLFLLVSSFSFSTRFVNQCRILERYDRNTIRCKSVESGKIFYFVTPASEIAREFKIGKIYKIWFEDEGDYDNGRTFYYMEDWKFIK